jgi:sulfatase modifying factor 1
MSMFNKLLLGILFLAAAGIVIFIFKPLKSDLVAASLCVVTNPELVLIKGGEFIMGAAGMYPEEFLATLTQVKDFMLSRYETTDKEFAEFVAATGYKTVAERMPDPSLYPDIDSQLLKPGSAVFIGLSDAVKTGTLLNSWHFTEGANWQSPNGADSNIDGMDYYPVVHIAHADAEAYAKWKGHRLPTEAEFEFAARGGLVDKKYASCDSYVIDGEYQGNTWQGLFPFQDTGEDGHVGIASVGGFKPSAYGAYNMIGNVWEWTSSTYYPQHFTRNQLPEGLPEQGYDPHHPGIAVGVIKGGSYLCADDFCARYRPAARHAQDTGLGTSHIGFRTVKDV